MKPSEALAEVKAAINLLHFASGPAKAVLQAILEGKHDPAEKAPAADKVANTAAIKAPATKVD